MVALTFEDVRPTDREDTPPAVPAMRHGSGEHVAGIDPVWFHEWRRELSGLIKELRKSHDADMSEVRAHLSGIQGDLRDGAASIDKHDQQIGELIDTTVAIEGRLDKVERDGGTALVQRIAVLEVDKIARDRAADVAAALAQQSAKSPLRLWVNDAASTAAKLMGAIVASAIVGLVVWLVALWVKAGAPGLQVPAP